ncbi:PAS domain S-box protein [bacterium]|nr:PAS domain S-box protein [bacterium]
MSGKTEKLSRILIADDEQEILDIFVETLMPGETLTKEDTQLSAMEGRLFGDTTLNENNTRFEVVTCRQATDAVNYIERSYKDKNPFSIVFLDVRMPPGENGIWAAQRIRELDAEIEIVLVTGYSDVQPESFFNQVLPVHKLLFVRKPFFPQEILQFAHSLGEKWRTEKELKENRAQLAKKLELGDQELKRLNEELTKDLADRKKVEADLKRFRLAMDIAAEGIFITDPDSGQFLDVNQRACGQLGYERSELLSKTVMDIETIFPTLEDFREHVKAVRKKKGSILIARGEQVRKDGKVFPVEVGVCIQRVENQELLLSTVRDITEWKQVTDELSASREHLAQAQQISHLGSWEWDLTTGITKWSDEGYRIFGSIPQSHPIDIDLIKERLHPDDVRILIDDVVKALKQGVEFDSEYRLIVPDEGKKYVRVRGQAYQDDSGQTIKIVGTAQDITKRKHHEKEMQHLRNLLSNIIDSMPSILIGLDEKGKINQWNREAQKFTGISATDAYNNQLSDVYPKFIVAADMALRAITEGSIIQESKLSISQDSKNFLFNIVVYPLITDKIEGAVVLIENVTEKVRMEEIMLQTEKMFTVGGLAAGMAHEINNPLAGIIQNLQVIRNRLSSSIAKNELIAKECGTTMAIIEDYIKRRNLDKSIQRVIDAGQRAARIVENMLNFSYKAGTVYTMHSLVDLLESSIELACNEYDLKKRFDFRHIELIKEYDPKAPRVPCEGNTMQQVFFNILKNGAYAMANHTQSSEQPRFIFRIVPEKEMVRVEIEDNGPGIDEETRKRVFEPFFTTKEKGVGTGLGLAVSYFIVTENHGGEILVDSKPGKGSNFIIRLPI